MQFLHNDRKFKHNGTNQLSTNYCSIIRYQKVTNC